VNETTSVKSRLLDTTKSALNATTDATTTPVLPTLSPEWKCQLHNDYLCKILEKTLRMNLQKEMLKNTTLDSDLVVGNDTFKAGTTVSEEYFKYYTLKVLPPAEGKGYWVDFKSLKPGAVQTKTELINSHRKASHVALTFDFPFYGLNRRAVTITTGGFLFMGDQLHSWLAASQFVAPLMANFGTDYANDSVIHFFDNGTTFTVEWSNVMLVDQLDAGKFSFQASLKENGDIIFAYGSLPTKVSEVSNASHPVKIGISDAYTIHHDILYLRRKTIYEYHRVDLKDKHEEMVTNGTAFYFTAHKTCVSFTDCRSCLTANVSFQCMWCPQAQRCSDGFDRFRQDWHLAGCDKVFFTSPANCTVPPTVPPTTTRVSTATSSTATTTPSSAASSSSSSHEATKTDGPPTSKKASPSRGSTTPRDDLDLGFTPKPRQPAVIPKYKPTQAPPVSGSGRTAAPEKVKAPREDDEGDAEPYVGTTGIVMGVLVSITLVSTALWVLYAYKFPHSRSGQLLIRYRPTQWRMFRREVRYTATSLHM
ncbi:unnamed protein product, partial [Notodromas monacha]